MRSVLLVHGAWHGAWCFDRVLPLLTERGIDARALDLPGHGASSEPLGDLYADSDRVRQTLDGMPSDVVLVGHSYGGAVVTDVGEHPAVGTLVYLAAFALSQSESCAHAGFDEPDVASIGHDGRPDLASGLTVDADGISTVGSDVARRCFFNDCDDATIAWALERLGGQPMVALGQSPRATAWRSKASTYVVCTNDLAVHPGLQRIMARRCTQTLEWPTGHSPFLSQPTLLASLLIDLVRADVTRA